MDFDFVPSLLVVLILGFPRSSVLASAVAVTTSDRSKKIREQYFLDRRTARSQLYTSLRLSP